MKAAELSRIIVDAGLVFSFMVRTEAAPDLLPDDIHITEPAVDEPGKWVVYYTERGHISPLGTFDNEDAACDFTYQLLQSKYGLS